MRFLLIYLSFASLFLASCRDASELYPPTSIEIMDPVRHYYPVVQGEKFEININIKNTGKHSQNHRCTNFLWLYGSR